MAAQNLQRIVEYSQLWEKWYIMPMTNWASMSLPVNEKEKELKAHENAFIELATVQKLRQQHLQVSLITSNYHIFFFFC